MNIELELVKCSRCDMPDLIWDRTWNENTGKWRLFNQSLEIPHVCPKEPEAEPPKMVKCPKCDPQTRKLMTADKLQTHIKNEHIDWGDYS